MPPSQPKLDSLAAELLDQILVNLDLVDISRLSCCNRRLNHDVEQTLYGNATSRNRAMKWACETGNTSVVHRAIAYGSSPSIVPVPRRQIQTAQSPQSLNTPTLYLAARHGQVATFRRLIQLGSRVDEREVDPLTVRALVERLCHPVDFDLLDPFLQSGLASQLGQQMRDEALIFVATSVAPIVPLDIVRMLLDGGASPNCVRSGRAKDGSISPLSAALITRRTDLFQLLVARGADVNGIPYPPRPAALPTLPLHIPACTAALAMAEETESTGLLQLCLDQGADINVQVPFLQDRGSRLVTFTTPLLMYLGKAASQWIDTDSQNSSLAKLRYLLDNGAKATVSSYSINEIDVLLTGRYRFESPLSPVQLLMNSLTSSNLVTPSLLSAVKLLTQHGGLQSRTGEILARYDFFEEGSGHESAPIITAWEEFLTTLLADSSQHEDLDTFLFKYVTTKGNTGPRASYYGAERRIGALAYVTIKRLIAAGADINFRESSYAPTALQRLCEMYNKSSLGYDILGEYVMGYLRRQRVITMESRDLVRFLAVDCGADPSLKWRERTAAETLQSGWDKLGPDEQQLAQEMMIVLQEAPKQ